MDDYQPRILRLVLGTCRSLNAPLSCFWPTNKSQWYQFTGLTKEESVGEGYQQVIHEEDLPKLIEKWEHQQREGVECEIEVRYRRHDGVYRWMLARACPLKDDNGKILKWYGTNTDIHDLVMARIEAARNKLQMLTVLAHAEVNLFSINKDRIVTMAEGGMFWDSIAEEYDVHTKSTLIGKDAIEVAQHTQPGGIPGTALQSHARGAELTANRIRKERAGYSLR